MEEKVQARIEQLEKELDQFVVQANQQVAAYNAAIAELKKLLAPPDPDDEIEEA
jgi:hypothetical protein